MRVRHHFMTVAATIILIVAVAACSSSAPSSSPESSSPGSAAQGGSTTPATASPSPDKATAVVDLTFSGPLSVVAKGTAGQCTLGRDSAGKVSLFGFGATEADYAGLGQGFYVSEAGALVNIKWIVDAKSAFLNFVDIDAISADHHSIQIDSDLGRTLGKEEHVKGTIICP